ncbi:MAG TPA: type II toxin-antitoxin system RelE/ParE family toxin [Burkholderiales bacterium]|nr:type II toxin-antitoxin system RelE/ParE family toxin [Burkholderiales bacterium]
MAGYRLVIKKSAAKELEQVEPRTVRRRLVAAIEALGVDPRPAACEKLAGAAEAYRIRQGDYRAVYAIDDKMRVVIVVKLGHRREVYR